MVAQRIQGDYDCLQEFLKVFINHASMTAELTIQIIKLAEQLQSGAWRGIGAEAFYAEIGEVVLPAMRKLEDALQLAGEGTGKIHHILCEAEEEAARLFRGEGEHTPALAKALKISTKVKAEQTGTGNLGLPLPPPPPPPPPNDGAGPHGVRQATDTDWVSWREWSLVPYMAESFLVQQADAARHMRHFLGNSGQDLIIDVERMLKELPDFKISADDFFEHVFTPDLQKEVESRLATQPLPFGFQHTSPWQFYYADKDESPNWFHALGGFSYVYGAEVIVQDVGGMVTVTINTQIHVFDRYNWDPMKKTDIDFLGIVPDSTLGALHQAGIAHEFEIWGHTNATQKEFRYDPSQKWVQIPPPSTPQPSR